MRRREFMTLVGSTAITALPFVARAQQGGNVDRIGFLRVGEPPPTFIDAFRRAMKEKGRVEGRNYVLDFGIAESVDLLPDIAADLVRRNVNILVASGTPAVLPARNATNTIPGRRSHLDRRGREPGAPRRKCHRIDSGFRRSDGQAARASQGDAADPYPRCARVASSQSGS